VRIRPRELHHVFLTAAYSAARVGAERPLSRRPHRHRVALGEIRRQGSCRHQAGRRRGPQSPWPHPCRRPGSRGRRGARRQLNLSPALPQLRMLPACDLVVRGVLKSQRRSAARRGAVGDRGTLIVKGTSWDEQVAADEIRPRSLWPADRRPLTPRPRTVFEDELLQTLTEGGLRVVQTASGPQLQRPRGAFRAFNQGAMRGSGYAGGGTPTSDAQRVRGASP
jgi:hypothetical protein